MMKFSANVKILMAISIMLSLASCITTRVRGQSPFVQINGIQLQDQNLTLDLGVRNVNFEAIMIEHIQFSIELDERSLSVYNAASEASVIANGTENLRFNLVASAEGIDLLNSLERGDRADLEYSLEGVLQVNEGGQMKILRSGYIYPVPGRPGNFR